MKSLRARLAQFDRAPALAPPAGTEERRQALGSLLAQGAVWVGDGPGAYLRREIAFEVGARDCLHPGLWTLLGAEPPTSAAPWAVVDTETTGLESGTGTLVFLVAVLFWEGERARLVQYFLPEPVAEPLLLRDLVDDLERVSGYLSYNGRSFDWPRLRTRLRLHRIEEDVLDRPHLDLIHPVRRLVREWLPDARLATVERVLLGRPRVDDLPGSEAPDVYRALQTDGLDTGLDRVLIHNDLDVRRLVDVARRVAAVVDEGQWRDLPPAARWALARLFVERGEAPRAEEILLGVTEEGQEPYASRARRLRAEVLRRRGQTRAAAECLEEGLAESELSLDIRVRLAKLYEHRLHDLPRARELTLEALRRGADLDALGRSRRPVDCRPEALHHRLRRLERKIARAIHG